jgi:putative hydrolase of the HAD superfamily
VRNKVPIRALFVDVGGVLLTNGWDHVARKRAARNFQLDWTEMDDRHRLVFETHEEGKLSFEEYLNWVVFYKKRTFTHNQFRDFMFAQSKPYPRMIELILQLKQRNPLKIVIVSNESRAVNAHRISAFKLDQLAHTFISSCFVRMRKPDADIFRLALDLAQTPADQVVFIDNTSMFVTIAEGLGMRGILHTDVQSTSDQLAALGLTTGDRPSAKAA